MSQPKIPFQPNMMWETMEPTLVERFRPICVVFPPIAPFVLFVPSLLKIAQGVDSVHFDNHCCRPLWSTKTHVIVRVALVLDCQAVVLL